MVTKDLGMVTAYAYAVAGGYTGTEAEFTQLMADLAVVVDDFDNFSVTVTTLPAGSSATASYSNGVLSLGIPKGDKGDTGNTGATGATPQLSIGTVETTAEPSVTITGTVDNPVLNFGLVKGDKGDTGEVSEAELAEALEDFAENGTVANAEQLTTDIRANDQTPYLFRTSGGSVDIGDREYINGIVGGTVVWNQFIQLPSVDQSLNEAGVHIIDHRNGSFTFYTDEGGATAQEYCHVGQQLANDPVKKDHVFAILGLESSSSAQTWRVSDQYNGVLSVGVGKSAGVVKATGNGRLDARLIIANGAVITTPITITPQYFDLTQMFGSTIADYIYSLETATAGAGVAFFKTLFPKPYYAYDAGELMSVKGLVSHDMVGFNAWDLTSGKAKVVGGHQYEIVGTYTSLSLDGETITPSSGKFTPSKDGELTVVGGNSTTCVHLVWDGSEDGNYEPYQKWSYPLDSDLELRGIPKLDASNNLYYDGDVYESDGTVTRKYGVRAYQSGDESDTSVITDKTNTVYPLQTPTTETADPYQNPQIVDDFGTEEFVISNTVVVPIPVGHNTDYPVNLKAKVEMMPNSPDGNGDYIVRQTNGVNEYVALSNNATIQNIISRLEALEG